MSHPMNEKAIETGGPAFPMADPFVAKQPKNGADAQRLAEGMTLRDYFAAHAMQAYLSGHIAHYGHENYWRPEDIAHEAYGSADAMLKAREGGAA